MSAHVRGTSNHDITCGRGIRRLRIFDSRVNGWGTNGRGGGISKRGGRKGKQVMKGDKVWRAVMFRKERERCGTVLELGWADG
jgi:hypothetical protein